MSLTGAIQKRRTARASSRNSYTRSGKGVSFSVRVPNLLPWILTIGIGTVIIALVSIALLFAYRFFTTSEYFAVKEIRVSGNARLGDGEILSLAGLAAGDNALAVRMDDVEVRLLHNPWIAGVSVKRELPDTFHVQIAERVPVWWRMQDGKLVYADSIGAPIAQVGPEKFVSLPVLTIEPGMDHLLRRLPVLKAELRSAKLPVDMRAASWVRISHARGVEMFLENTKLNIALSLEDWRGNILRLGAVLNDLSRRNELRQVQEVRVQGTHVWVRRDSGSGQ